MYKDSQQTLKSQLLKPNLLKINSKTLLSIYLP